MKLMIGYTLGLIVFLNFAYRLIRMARIMFRKTYAEDTVHRFQCKKCEEVHRLSGPEARRIRWAPRIRKSTPRSQSTSYVFTCPHCQKRTSQIYLYDTTVTKGEGMVRVQMNDYQKPLLVDFLIKGLGPVVLLSFVFRLLG